MHNFIKTYFQFIDDAIASSMLSEGTDPTFAIDGKFGNIFHSKGDESYPWLQAHLKTTSLVESVTIVNRLAGPDQFDNGYFLKDVEVRVGSEALLSNFTGPITINHLCGHFFGPGESGGIYTIKCQDETASDFVSVQVINPDHKILQITEILINEFKSTARNGNHFHLYIMII